MTLSGIGGSLVVAGGALVGIAFVAYLDGAGVGFGETNTQGLIVNAALGALALGLAILAVAPPVRGRVVHVGLALLAAGPASELTFSILVSASPDGWVPGSPVFLLEVGGALAAFLGALLLGVALARAGGWPRAVGALLVIATLLNALLTILGSNRVPLPPHTALAGLGLAVLAEVSVGVLAIVGARAHRSPDGSPR